jgi:hypothetical protein
MYACRYGTFTDSHCDGQIVTRMTRIDRDCVGMALGGESVRNDTPFIDPFYSPILQSHFIVLFYSPIL